MVGSHRRVLYRDLVRYNQAEEARRVQVMEELVAELGSAFLYADLNITPEISEDHAAYIGNWLKELKDDKRVIFSAASHASKTAEYLHSLQPKPAE